MLLLSQPARCRPPGPHTHASDGGFEHESCCDSFSRLRARCTASAGRPCTRNTTNRQKGAAVDQAIWVRVHECHWQTGSPGDSKSTFFLTQSRCAQILSIVGHPRSSLTLSLFPPACKCIGIPKFACAMRDSQGGRGHASSCISVHVIKFHAHVDVILPDALALFLFPL